MRALSRGARTVKKGATMLVKTYAKNVDGGHGYRRFLLAFHIALLILAIFFSVMFLIEILAADATADAYTPANSFTGFILLLAGVFLAPNVAAVIILVVSTVFAVLLLWPATLFFRKRYIHCVTNVGTTVYAVKVYQLFRPATLAVISGGDRIVPDTWYSDKNMKRPAPATCRMTAKSMLFFAEIALPEEPAADTAAPAAAAAPVVREPGESEIQAIIREALEREASRAAAPAPAPASVPVEQPAPVAEPAPVEVPAPAESVVSDDDSDEDEDESEIREVVVNGRTFHMIIRYSRSFTARVIQAPDTLKGYYAAIKNELLSYNLVKSRISWKHDAFNRGRLQLAKLVVRGKSLCVYLALDPGAYEAEKYHHVDKGDTNAYAKVPMMIRIKSDLGLRKAKFLVSEMMANYEIERGETQDLDYQSSYAYRDTKTLVEEGLIKELETTESAE